MITIFNQRYSIFSPRGSFLATIALLSMHAAMGMDQELAVLPPEVSNLVARQTDMFYTVRNYFAQKLIPRTKIEIGDGYRIIYSIYSRRSIALSPDGGHVIVPVFKNHHDELLVKMFNGKNGQCIRTLKLNDGYDLGFVNIALSPDGKILVAVSNNYIYIWNLETNKYQKESVHDGSNGEILLLVVQFNQDGKTFVTGSRDDKFRIWDIENFRCIDTIDGFRRGSVGVVIKTPDGKTGVAISRNKNELVILNHLSESFICYWEDENCKITVFRPRDPNYYNNKVIGLKFDHKKIFINPETEKQYIAVDWSDNCFKLKNIECGSRAISHDGNTIAIGGRDNNEVTIYDLKSLHEWIDGFNSNCTLEELLILNEIMQGELTASKQ